MCSGQGLPIRRLVWWFGSEASLVWVYYGVVSGLDLHGWRWECGGWADCLGRCCYWMALRPTIVKSPVWLEKSFLVLVLYRFGCCCGFPCFLLFGRNETKLLLVLDDQLGFIDVLGLLWGYNLQSSLQSASTPHMIPTLGYQEMAIESLCIWCKPWKPPQNPKPNQHIVQLHFLELPKFHPEPWDRNQVFWSLQTLLYWLTALSGRLAYIKPVLQSWDQAPKKEHRWK